jgi:ABC-type oligopeptide transport system substrate-binding subunit
MKTLKIILSASIVGFVLFACVPGSNNSSSSSGAPRSSSSVSSSTFNYLNDINEVAWVQLNGNNLYIGFTSFPSDVAAIIRAAALTGNRETNFGFHVWAVEASRRDYAQNPGGRFFEVTARNGRIE